MFRLCRSKSGHSTYIATFLGPVARHMFAEAEVAEVFAVLAIDDDLPWDVAVDLHIGVGVASDKAPGPISTCRSTPGAAARNSRTSWSKAFGSK